MRNLVLQGKGRKTVAAAGTEEALVSTSTPAKYLIVQALKGNTNDVTVGTVGVDGALATRDGIALSAGDFVPLFVDNLNQVYVDAITNGEGVSYVYFT